MFSNEEELHGWKGDHVWGGWITLGKGWQPLLSTPLPRAGQSPGQARAHWLRAGCWGALHPRCTVLCVPRHSFCINRIKLSICLFLFPFIKLLYNYKMMFIVASQHIRDNLKKTQFPSPPAVTSVNAWHPLQHLSLCSST